MNKGIGFSKAGNLLSLLKINEILDDPKLTIAEKREIFASWISDAHAVDDAPALREIDNGILASVDEISMALKSLDQDDEPPAVRRSLRPYELAA
jgi:hypothetical protein